LRCRRQRLARTAVGDRRAGPLNAGVALRDVQGLAHLPDPRTLDEQADLILLTLEHVGVELEDGAAASYDEPISSIRCIIRSRVSGQTASVAAVNSLMLISGSTSA